MSDSNRQPTSPAVTFRRWALMTVMLTIGIRTLVVVGLNADLNQDQDSYAVIAENIHLHSVFGRPVNVLNQDSEIESRLLPTAYRPPLYPMILSVFVQDGKLNRMAIGGLHVIAGTLTTYLVFLYAWRLGMVRLSFVAAMGVAIDPLLLRSSALVMTETVATLCAMAALVAVTRFQTRRDFWSAILAGFFLGICIACRPTFLVWAGLIGLLMLRQVMRKRIKLHHFAAFCLTIILLMLPWTIRNQSQIGKPVFATTHGGYTLLLANNQSLFDHQAGKLLPGVWDRDRQFIKWNEDAILLARKAQENQQTSHWELEYDRLCNQKARNDIANNPGAFVKACLLRVVQLWRPLPNRIVEHESWPIRSARYAICIWYTVLFAFALAALWRIRDKVLEHPWCWALMLPLSITIVHVIYWSNIRMRAPSMPVIWLLATYGIGRFFAFRKRQRRRKRVP